MNIFWSSLNSEASRLVYNFPLISVPNKASRDFNLGLLEQSKYPPTVLGAPFSEVNLLLTQ